MQVDMKTLKGESGHIMEDRRIKSSYFCQGFSLNIEYIRCEMDIKVFVRSYKAPWV